VGKIRLHVHQPGGERAHQFRPVLAFHGQRLAVGVLRVCLGRLGGLRQYGLRQRQPAGKGVHAALIIAQGRAHVAPVSLHGHPQNVLAQLQQQREQILGEIVGHALGHIAQDARGENIDAGVYQIGHHPLPAGLFNEGAHQPVPVGHGQTVAQRFAVAVQGEGGGGPPGPVGVHQRGKVEIAGRVPADDHKIVFSVKTGAVFHAPGRAQRRVLDAVFHVDAEGGPVAEVVHDRAGVVFQRGADLGNPVPPQQLHNVLHHRPAQQGSHWLGRVAGDGFQPFALAAGHNHGFHWHSPFPS